MDEKCFWLDDSNSLSLATILQFAKENDIRISIDFGPVYSAYTIDMCDGMSTFRTRISTADFDYLPPEMQSVCLVNKLNEGLHALRERTNAVISAYRIDCSAV